MKRYISFFFQCCLFTTIFAQKYYPEGTNWIELRLDTTKYESWYTTIEEDGIVKTIPNYVETHYYVKGDTIPKEGYIQQYKIVWQKKEDEVDSLQFLISENLNGIDVATLNLEETTNCDPFSYPSGVYSFDDWQTGKLLTYMDLYTAQLTGYHYSVFCTISEIKEKSFGGCRPLKYVETDGGQILIQGIGVTSWDDYYCIFGPARLNEWLYFDCEDNYEKQKEIEENCSHYRSMLVHFERNGEVLYDVWPSPEDYAYRPFVEEGKVWNMEKVSTWVGWPDYGVVRTEKWELKGDTVINGVTYKKYYEEGVFRMAMREENQKVYTFKSYEEVLLYDFGLKEGERFTTYDGQEYVFTSEDYVEYDNKELRRMELVNVNDSRDINYWIEGIGALAGPTTPFYYGMTGGEDSSIASCYVGDQCIYRRDPDSIQLPTKDTQKPTYFDLSGRRLEQKPQKGIYIEGGKKVLVK